MKPYSLDLRRRVLHAYLNGEGSQRQLADRFKVSPDFVYRLLKRYRETGTVAPAKVHRPNTAKMDADGLQELKKLIMADPDATLRTLAERFEEAVGIDVSVATICRARQRLRSRHALNGSHDAIPKGADSRSQSETTPRTPTNSQ
ncbi:MAG: transposase [Rhodothermales bacterium]|nr:transposase [Rhodothermales bacterium]